MPAIPKRAECRRFRRCPFEISKEIPELRLPVPLETWANTNCWRSSKSSPIRSAHRFLSDTVNCPTGERKKLARVFLALVCALGLAFIGPTAAQAGGQKKQQQSRGLPYAGHAPSYRGIQQSRALPYAGQAPAGYPGAGGGGYQVNVSTNKSALTGKPTTVQALHQNSTIRQVGTPTGAGRQTTVGKLTGTGKQTTAAKQTTVSKPTTVGKPTGTGKGTTVGKLTGAGTPTTLGKPTTIARRPPFNTANTPRTEVTPTVQLQQNSVQLLNPPRTNVASALQLQQIHLPGPTQSLESLRLDKLNKFSQVGGIGTGSVRSSKLNKFSQVGGNGTGGSGGPEPGGGFEFRSSKLNKFSQVGGSGTGGSGQPGGSLGQPDGGLGQPGGAPERPPTVTSTSHSATAENKPITETAPAAQFQQNKRILGSDRWVDSDYEVFRNYRSEWHDRDWWRTHQSRIVFGVGGWYYWNAGYWFPAWGYDPAVEYAYDGPIYAYNDLPPDQMIANAQRMLQQQGYYQGEPDGLLAAPTTAALVDYQRAHGLYETSTIDRPTSQSLGMK